MNMQSIPDNQRQRKMAIAINYVNLVLRVISSFWVTGIIVSTLGMAEYGLISLSGSVLVMLPLITFGINYTIPRYVSEYRAKGDLQGMQNFLGVCQKMLYVVALVASGVCCFLYFQLEIIFPNLTPEELGKVKIMFIMLSAGSVIYFFQSIYIHILESFQCFVLTYSLSGMTMFLTMIGSVLFVLNGYGAVGVTAVSLIIQILNIFPARIYCWKKLGIMPNLRYWDWSLTKKCLYYSFWAFLGTISGFFGENLAPLIIGSACTSIDVSIFRIGTIITLYFAIGSNAAGVFFPKVVEMVTNNASGKELTDMMIKVARIDFSMALLFVGGFVLIGRQFLELWLSGKDLQPYMVTVWHVGLMSCCVVPFFASVIVGWQIMRAKDLLKFRTVVEFVPNFLGSSLGYLMALKYGIFGYLWCRLALIGVIQLIFTLVYFNKAGELDIPRFMKSTYLNTMIPALVSISAGGVYLYFVPIDSWFGFIVAGTIYTVLYAGAAWLFTLNKNEKGMASGIALKGIRSLRRLVSGV